MAINQNIWDKGHNDIVFEGRNHRYGAYRIRRQYPVNVLIGFLSALIAVLLIFYMQDIIEWLKGQRLSDDNYRIVNVNTMPAPPNVIAPMNYSPPGQQHDLRLLPKVVHDSIPKIQPKPADQQTAENKDSAAAKNEGGSNGTDTAAKGNEATFYVYAEKAPQFPGGPKAMEKYIQQNLQYPKIDMQLNHQGKVVVHAIVNPDGTLTEIGISSGLTPTMNAEAVRIVESMPPWEPGIVKEHPVRIYVNIPIHFALKR